MKSVKVFLLASALLASLSCASKNEKKKEIVQGTTASKQDLKKYETAYFASGCFWCVEAVFESVKGVKEVVSGYSGGTEEDPTYEQVGRGRTSHAEAVKVYYDPKVVNFTTLVTVFFGSHDPTTLNRQGPDAGPQYRSIAFYKNESEKKIINQFIQLLEENKSFKGKITTEVSKFDIFYDAEAYHQDFEKRNPNNSYVKNVSVPRLNSFKKRFPHLLKKTAH